MTGVRSLLFNIWFFGWTTVVCLSIVPLMLAPTRAMHRAAKIWAGGVFVGLKAIAGIDWEVRGHHNLMPGAAIIASKHQSAWDTMVFHLVARMPVFVLKRELLFIPFFGWYLAKAGNISIDRKAGSRALKDMAKQADRALALDRQVVIFPEGTRTPPGAQTPYHPGIAALYKAAGVPVVPVALNSGLFWGRRAFRKHAGKVVIEFLEPIPPGMDRKAFMKVLHERIETASARLAEEARQRYGFDLPPLADTVSSQPGENPVRNPGENGDRSGASPAPGG